MQNDRRPRCDVITRSDGRDLLRIYGLVCPSRIWVLKKANSTLCIHVLRNAKITFYLHNTKKSLDFLFFFLFYVDNIVNMAMIMVLNGDVDVDSFIREVTIADVGKALEECL